VQCRKRADAVVVAAAAALRTIQLTPADTIATMWSSFYKLARVVIVQIMHTYILV
jgi:hypothetical protein